MLDLFVIVIFPLVAALAWICVLLKHLIKEKAKKFEDSQF